MERAVLLCTGLVILPVHLPAEKMRAEPAATTNTGPQSPVPPSVAAPQLFESVPAGDTGRILSRAQEDERQRILDALGACAGNQSRAAKMLGIPRRTFVGKLDLYRIPRPKKDLEE